MKATSSEAGTDRAITAPKGLPPMAAISLTFTARQRQPMSWGVDQSRRKCTPSSCVSVVKRRSLPAVERSTAQSSPIPRIRCGGAVFCRRCCKRSISANSPSSLINMVIEELAYNEIQDPVRYEDRLDDRLLRHMTTQSIIRQSGGLHHVSSTIGRHGHCTTHLPINLHGHLDLPPTGQRCIIDRITLPEDGSGLPQAGP